MQKLSRSSSSGGGEERKMSVTGGGISPVSTASSGSVEDGQRPGTSVNWSAYSCSQNLPAILNDPKRGKQVGKQVQLTWYLIFFLLT